MSSSRSPDDKPVSKDAAERKSSASPGRYSLADAEGPVPKTRIDSTSRMPAVRPEGARISQTGSPVADGSKEKDTKKKAPVGLPSRTVPAVGANRGGPPSKGGAVGSPSSKRAPDPPAPVKKMSSPPPPARPPSIFPPPAPTRRISSLRPPPPPKAASIVPAPLLGLEGFDEGSIAFAFDALISEGAAGQPGTHEFDLQPVRELFSELAANHMRHVRDFMIDVKWGEVTRDWIHICVPPVRTLRRAAERLELVELGLALERLGGELDKANATGGQMLDTNEKHHLLGAYEELVVLLPQAFALDRDKTQREAVIVQALLTQVPDVRKVTIDKLAAAGLTSLTELFAANAHDIAHVAGIQHSLALKIVDRLEAYRTELQSSSPQDARAAEREKLAVLNGQLRDSHCAYEEASSGWGPDAKAKKRDHFLAREETWLEIRVLLARFGEVDRLQGIEKVPFAQRIAQLTDYIEEARDKYRSPEA